MLTLGPHLGDHTMPTYFSSPHARGETDGVHQWHYDQMYELLQASPGAHTGPHGAGGYDAVLFEYYEVRAILRLPIAPCRRVVSVFLPVSHTVSIPAADDRKQRFAADPVS